MKTTKLNPKPKRKANRRFAAAQCSTARPATPRVDAVEYVSSKVSPRMAVDAEFARDLERYAEDEIRKHFLTIEREQKVVAERNQLRIENAALCEFINREMKMTASDPRIAKLEKRIAALSNVRMSDGK